MATILHIDLDAFFASCEQVREPSLDGEPVVVCIRSGRGTDGGAVSTASYAAREHGIHAGMPIVTAKDIAAETDREFTFVDADHDFYKTVSERVMDLVRERAREVEAASIDEAYADLSHLDGRDAARQVARDLKREIQASEGLTASVGIGPNKLVAKIASDREKPDGLTVVAPDAVQDFLDPLPVDELHGVGPKTAERLAGMDVGTVRELREVSAQRLVRTFGEAAGRSLYDKARGEGSTELEEQKRKQLSKITTLEEDAGTMRELRPVVRDLADRVMDRVEDRDWRYSRAAIIAVTPGNETRTRSTSFKTPTADRERFYRAAEDLLQEFLDGHDGDLRRVGVRAGGFETSGQRSLADFRSR